MRNSKSCEHRNKFKQTNSSSPYILVRTQFYVIFCGWARVANIYQRLWALHDRTEKKPHLFHVEQFFCVVRLLEIRSWFKNKCRVCFDDFLLLAKFPGTRWTWAAISKALWFRTIFFLHSFLFMFFKVLTMHWYSLQTISQSLEFKNWQKHQSS